MGRPRSGCLACSTMREHLSNAAAHVLSFGHALAAALGPGAQVSRQSRDRYAHGHPDCRGGKQVFGPPNVELVPASVLCRELAELPSMAVPMFIWCCMRAALPRRDRAS